jgi:hypothetical protein
MLLKVGDRFGVYEVLPGNVYAAVNGKKSIRVGQHIAERDANRDVNRDVNYVGITLPSGYGNCYHMTSDTSLKKIGTLVITKIK